MLLLELFHVDFSEEESNADTSLGSTDLPLRVARADTGKVETRYFLSVFKIGGKWPRSINLKKWNKRHKFKILDK